MKVQYLVTLLFLALALSGCASETEDPPANDAMTGSETDETGGLMANATDDAPMNTTGPADPAESFVNLVADVLGGDAPITVAFTLDGQQNESIGYTLDFGDGETVNGTTSEFPLTISHEFLYSGEYEAILTGEYVDEFGEFYQYATVSLSLTGAAPPPSTGATLGDASFADGGTVILGVQGATGCTLPAPANTLNEVTHTIGIPDNYFGILAYVSTFAIQFTNGDTAIDIDVEFLDPAGTVLGSSAGFEVVDGNESFTVDGNFGAGDYTMKVTSCAAVNGEYTFEVIATFNAQ
jgi:hypothetical protein